MTLTRITPLELKRRLDAGESPLLLDVRRSEALMRHPEGIADAIPVLLDEAEPKIPDMPRSTPIVAYCLCSGQASSTRVALWLQQSGYTRVSVLEGGLPGWEAQDLPLAPISVAERRRVKWMSVTRPHSTPDRGTGMIAERAFLAGQQLPIRREMAVLFVDMVDSTHLLFAHSPEKVLELVQAFMQVVVEIAVQHCGDVHDFEGDGAMLYFAGAGEAVPAAFNLREALAAKRHSVPDLPLARFALDAGPLVVGYVGTNERRSLSFIGPSVHTAARILKLAGPESIAATGTVVALAQRTDPDLAARFEELPERQMLKGFAEPMAVYLARAVADCDHCDG